MGFILLFKFIWPSRLKHFCAGSSKFMFCSVSVNLKNIWVRSASSAADITGAVGSNGIAVPLLTWTGQPSHVRLCLRSPCVAADWPRAAVMSSLHNSARWNGAATGCGYTWGGRWLRARWPTFSLVSRRRHDSSTWGRVRQLGICCRCQICRQRTLAPIHSVFI